ncbi:Estrogen receptor beta [Varanus komodoensis]|nr:Estrogen receptor beta [Varanus komodoensis]
MSLCAPTHKECTPLPSIQELACSKTEAKSAIPELGLPIPFSCSQSALTRERSPVYLSSSYMENRHDYSAMAFYSPAVVNYNLPGNFSDSEGAPLRQPASPNMLWSSSGHISPLTLHCQSSVLYAEQPKSPWCDARPVDHVLPMHSILKSRDITLPTKVRIVKAMVFPVAMHGCESWTIRKTERQRIESFELWCWRRLLQVPWTARRSNRSVLEEINPDCSLEGQMLKMKLKYFGHRMRRKDSLEKSLILGTIDGKRRRGQQMLRWLDGVTEAVGVSLSGLWGMVEDRKAWRNVVHGVTMGRT